MSDPQDHTPQDHTTSQGAKPPPQGAKPPPQDERAPRTDEERRAFAEERESLWRITLAPTAWAMHFVVSYGATAFYCAKLAQTGLSITVLRLGLGVLSLVVLGFIAWIGWRSFRQWDVRRTGDFLNASGLAEDRHQFLGHAAFLLAIISFIGVVFSSMPFIVLSSCL
ncbi:MAG: hypothetical protein ABNH26_11315 [Celeribacter sp.]|jgi:hypothetical protein